MLPGKSIADIKTVVLLLVPPFFLGSSSAGSLRVATAEQPATHWLLFSQRRSWSRLARRSLARHGCAAPASGAEYNEVDGHTNGSSNNFVPAPFKRLRELSCLDIFVAPTNLIPLSVTSMYQDKHPEPLHVCPSNSSRARASKSRARQRARSSPLPPFERLDQRVDLPSAG